MNEEEVKPIQIIVNGTTPKAVEFIKRVQEDSNMELLSDDFLIYSQASTIIPASAIIVDFGDFKKNVKCYLTLGVDCILNIKKEFSFFKKELKMSLGNVVAIENLEETPCEKIIEAIMLLKNEKGTSRLFRLIN